MTVVEDHLAHYGVPGMKWGKRIAAKSASKSAERQHRNDTILKARDTQAKRQSELNALTAARIKATSAKGKAHLDSKIADKNFELRYSNDAIAAKQLTSGDKWMKTGKVAAILALSIVGAGQVGRLIGEDIATPGGLLTTHTTITSTAKQVS